jgi:hypothetical protein
MSRGSDDASIEALSCDLLLRRRNVGRVTIRRLRAALDATGRALSCTCCGGAGRVDSPDPERPPLVQIAFEELRKELLGTASSSGLSRLALLLVYVERLERLSRRRTPDDRQRS